MRPLPISCLAAWAAALALVAGCGPECPQAPVQLRLDVAEAAHGISPHLFGDQLEWVDPQLWDEAARRARSDRVEALRPMGLTLLRYPGGTLSDFFHWHEAVGPVDARTPQDTPFESTADHKVTRLPVFGPDEFREVATALGTEAMITVNAGTGTPEEAAAWLRHHQDQGWVPRYWEVGNEIYLEGDGYGTAAVRRTPEDYAAFFNATAAALRAVDPGVQVGVLGCQRWGRTAFCHDPDWNRKVLGALTERADFMSLHNSYSPAEFWWDPDSDAAFRALLAGAEAAADNFALVDADIAAHAPAHSRDLRYAVTEHAALYVALVPWMIVRSTWLLERNRSLAGALYSATCFHNFFERERVTVANHINVVHPLWQAHLNTDLGGERPVASAFGLMFQLYRAAAGGQHVPVTVEGSPTCDSGAAGFVDARAGWPALRATAVRSADGGTLYLFVVNRHLQCDLGLRVALGAGTVVGDGEVEVARLHAEHAGDFNDPDHPERVQVTTSRLAAAQDLDLVIPRHGLLRLAIPLAP